MNKLFITICLVVVCACSSCARKRVVLRTDVDLTPFEFVNGTFADLDREAALMKSSGKKAILMVFTYYTQDIDPNDIVGTYDSVKEIESIVTELSTAEDVSSSPIKSSDSGVWFVFSDGRGYGYAMDLFNGTVYLTDTERAHRPSDGLTQLSNNLNSDEPEEEGKSYPSPSPRDIWNRMDLRKSMPKGNFLEARIVELDHHGNVVYVRFKIPKGKMSEFQTGFGPCIIEARKDAEEARKKAKEAGEKPLLKLPYDPIGGITKLNQLRIITDMGAYMFYLTWTDDYVRFDGLTSKDFRKVLSDVGFKGEE